MSDNFKQFFVSSLATEHLDEIRELFNSLAKEETEKGHKRLAAGYGKSAFLVSVHYYWQEAVGPQMASHLKPLTMRGHTLILKADSPAYAQEFQYIKNSVLSRLNKYPELAEITAIKTQCAAK